MKPKSYGAGCVCTLWPVQPGISLVGVGICVCFPQLQVLETFKSDVYFLGIFFSPLSSFIPWPSPLLPSLFTRQRMTTQPVLGFGKGCVRSQVSGELEEAEIPIEVPTWLRGYVELLSEHLALPRANTFTELIPPVIIYCLHACRQSQVDRVS